MKPATCPTCGHALSVGRVPLTLQQQRVLALVRRSIAERGIAPTLKELADELGLSSSVTVHELLKALEAKGYVHRTRKRPRGITLLDEPAIPHSSPNLP